MKQCKHDSCRLYETGTELGEVAECTNPECMMVLTKAQWMKTHMRTVKDWWGYVQDASVFYLIMYLLIFAGYVLLGGEI